MKRIISLLLSITVGLSVLMTTVPVVMAAQTEGENPFEHWREADLSNITFTIEDGYEVATVSSGGFGFDTATTASSLEYDLRINSVTSSHDGNFSLFFCGGNTDPSVTNSTNKLWMEYHSTKGKFRVRSNSDASEATPVAWSALANGADYSYDALGTHKLTNSAWYHVKWEWSETEVALYLDGEKILSGDPSSRNFDLSVGTIRMSVYNTSISLRNITIDENAYLGKAYPDWTATDWSRGFDGAETLTKVSGSVKYTGEAQPNDVQFDFKLNSVTSTTDANISYNYILPSGNIFNFQYNPVAKIYQIRRLHSSGSYSLNDIATVENVVLSNTTWYTIRCVVMEDDLRMYINGELVLFANNTYDETVSFAGATITGYNTVPSVRNLTATECEALEPDPTLFEDWDLGTNWNLSIEGTDTVANPIAVTKGFTLKNATDADEMSFDFRLNDYGTPHDGNVGVVYYLSSGNRFFFEYNPIEKYYQIRRLDANGNNKDYLAKTENITLDKTTYHTMKVVVKENQLEMYVDGELVCSSTDTCGETLGAAKYRVTSYNTSPTIKNVVIDLPTIDETAFANWDTTDWSLGLEGNDTVATRINNSAGAVVMPLLGTSTDSEMSLDFRINSIISTSDNNVGIIYYLPSGNRFFFEYCHQGKYFQIRRLGSATNYLAKSDTISLDLNKWYTMSVVAKENDLQLLIDGEVMCSATNTCSEAFSDAQYKITSYNLVPSVKNIRLNNILIDEENKDYTNWNIDDTYRMSTVDGVQEIYGSKYSEKEIEFLAATNHNTIKFGMRVDGSEVQKNIYENVYQGDPVEHSEAGFSFQSAGGNEILFQYNKLSKAWEIIRYNNLDDSKVVLASKSAEITTGQWYEIKAVFNSSKLELYVDDEKVLSCTNDFDDMYSGRASLYSYGIKPSFRGMTLEGGSSIADPADNYDFDFNFDTDSTVSKFTVENGTTAYNSADTSLVFNITGENAALTSPVIKIPASREGVVEGYQYRAILPERNSILLYLKNNTPAEKLKVDFDLSTTNKYYDNQSVTIDIEPNSGYKAYLVNLSLAGTFAGELRGFRMKPIGATEGSIELDSIRFERETDLSYDYAGSVESCIADAEAETVTIKGTLDAEYAGKTVTLYETSVYNPYVQLIEDEILTTTLADGTSFTFTIPLKNAERNDISRLSSLFIVAVEGVKVSSRFTVDNFEDFKNNPYAETLDNAINQENIVNVADYGAVGDGFTNDTPAIQAAIDDIAAMGGGVVVVPGDTSTQYGKRYSCTSIMLRNVENIELRIEEGATILQSQTETDYEAIYEKWAANDCIDGGCEYCKLSYGHNHPQAVFDNPWAHIAISTHYPLVYLREVKNIKITGGGTLRGDDRGSNCENTSNGGDPRLWEGCNSRLHTVLLGGYKVDTAEISDILIKRSNCYNLSISDQNNVYVGNVAMVEATCSSSDGYASGSGGVVERMFAYVNDDVMKVSSGGNYDPRNHLWRYSPDATTDASRNNIIIRYCNVSGGWGMTFINWSKGKPYYNNCGIRNVEIHDNTFSGYRGSFGHWDDSDPNGVGGGCSTDVYMHNNYYPFPINGSLHSATNFITDLGISVNSREFKQGDFEHPLFGQEGYEDAYADLANWSYSGNVGVITESAENHFGYIKDGGKLYQGLFVSAAKHRICIDTKLVSGSATLYVANARTGEVIAQQDIAASDSFVTNYMVFNVESADDYYLGVELAEGSDAEVYIDNAQLDPPIVPDNPYNGEFTPDAGYVENYKGKDVNVLLWKEHGTEGTFDSADNTLITQNSNIEGYGQIGTNDAVLYNNVEGNINSIYTVGGDDSAGYRAFNSATQAAFTNSLLDTNLSYVDNSDVIRISDNDVGYGRNSEGFYTYYQDAEGQHTITSQGLENYTRRGQFEYYFPEGATVYNLVIGGHKIEGLRFGSYDIYAANSKEALYNAESLVYSYNDNVARDYLSLTDPSLQVYNIPEGLSAKYFAVVIYSSCSSDLSKHGSYSVDTCGATRISALQLYGTLGMETATLSFADNMGNVVYTIEDYAPITATPEQLAEAEAALPTIFGYSFVGWNDAAENVYADTTIKAIYTKSAVDKYTVYADNGTITYNALHQFDARVTVEAPADGFSYWKDTVSGKPISNKPVYTFFVPGDISLQAVYNDSENSAAEIVLNSAVQKLQRADGEFNLYFLGETVLPEGAVLDAVGITYTDSGDKLEALDTTVSDASNRIISASKTENIHEGAIMIVLSGVAEERYRYAKLYVTYTLEGEQITAYSQAVATGSTH